MSCVSLVLRLIDIPPFGRGAGNPPARVTVGQAVGLLPILAGRPREVDVRGGTITGRRLFLRTTSRPGGPGGAGIFRRRAGYHLARGTHAPGRYQRPARSARRGAQGPGP